MRKTMTFAAAMAAMLSLTQTLVWAAHFTVTVAAPSVVFFGRTTWNVSSSVSVTNTTAAAKSGPVTLFVFQVQPNGRVVEIQRQDLGIANVPAGAGQSAPAIPFSLELHERGSYVLLADVLTTNAGATAPTPHTHSGTAAFAIF